MAISKELLEILACPRCKGALQYRPDQAALDCSSCNLRYPIRDDISVMLTDEAVQIQ